MRKSGLILLISLVAGCSGSSLHPDALPASIESNYPTAEFSACGKHFQGKGMCVLPRGASLSEIGLSLQTYYNGTVAVDSPDCSYSDYFAYTGSQSVPLNLPGSVDHSCTIGFTVSPEYPSQHSQPIVIHSFRGYLRVRVVDPGSKWLGFSSRIREGEFQKATLPLNGTQRVVLRGCGLSVDQQMSGEGSVELDLAALGFKSEVKRCDIEGIVVGATPADDVLFSWMILVYSKDYLPLPRPVVSWNGQWLNIAADANVSVVTANQLAIIGRNAGFKISSANPITVRALTVGGRSAVGDWDPTTKTWNWVSDESF
jgi:hypothetical protein